MPVLVHRIGVVGMEVVAVHVVDESVVVVIEPVTGHLAGVDPDVVHKVQVQVVDSRIDNRNDHVRTAGRGLPGQRGIDIGIDLGVGLAGVVQSHLIGK